MDTTHPPIHKNPGGEPASLSLHLWAKLQSPFPFSFLTPLCSCCLTDLYLFQQQMSSIRPSHRSLLIVLIIHTDPIPLCFQKLAFLQASGWLHFFFSFFFFLAVILFPDSPSNFCMFLSVISKCLCWHKLLPTSAGKKESSKALAHIRMPDLCQYLFPSWFGSRSSTCYGGSGGCSRSRCCGWSGVAGFKHTVQHASVPVPRGLRLKLSNEKQCVPNCPHSNSQLLGECGFWIMAKLTIFFFFFSMLGLTPHEESLGY